MADGEIEAKDARRIKNITQGLGVEDPSPRVLGPLAHLCRIQLHHQVWLSEPTTSHLYIPTRARIEVEATSSLGFALM